MRQFEKVNVPPKLFFLNLFWEFVMFFQLKTSFHYSTDKAKVYAPKNKTSRGAQWFDTVVRGVPYTFYPRLYVRTTRV
jgi:hypothetical protein